ncbi:unnamed protein product [Oppiella nova]|uniref:Uncharacterized protein n=1 Tax=Oppiella nova TaxID=334625 RepID=A0A7R9QKN9_9ACAR|nr:unnamed protein product [Oppiella nova]CAG2167211.1 unnamed protein product [Oppiella nova]
MKTLFFEGTAQSILVKVLRFWNAVAVHRMTTMIHLGSKQCQLTLITTLASFWGRSGHLTSATCHLIQQGGSFIVSMPSPSVSRPYSLSLPESGEERRFYVGCIALPLTYRSLAIGLPLSTDIRLPLEIPELLPRVFSYPGSFRKRLNSFRFQVTETLKICDRAYMVFQGQVMAQGAPQELVRNPFVRQYYLGEGYRHPDLSTNGDRGFSDLEKTVPLPDDGNVLRL